MDNLIYRREIPVMIGVFINPGRRPDQPEPTPAGMGRPHHQPADRVQLARRQIRPRDRRRADAGARTRTTTSRRTRSGTASAAPVPAPSPRSPSPGSGPTQFRKVLSNVGSFVNLRGGARLSRDRAAKARRSRSAIFLQDGRNDNRGLGAAATTTRRATGSTRTSG